MTYAQTLLGRSPLGLWIKRMTGGTSTTELARDRARDLGPQRSSQAVEEVDSQSADFQPVHPSAATSRSLCRPRRGGSSGRRGGAASSSNVNSRRCLSSKPRLADCACRLERRASREWVSPTSDSKTPDRQQRRLEPPESERGLKR